MLPVAALVGLAMGVLSVCVLFLSSGSAAVAGNVCEQPQGSSSSVGIYYGQLGGGGQLNLYDLDLYGKEKEHAFPVANPVLTAANAGSPVSSGWWSTPVGCWLQRCQLADCRGPPAVSTPVLFEKEDKTFMFFEALTCPAGRTHIAAAESSDGGATWKALGPALQEASHSLSAPFVFEHKGAVYMIPSSPDAGEVRLYKASSFPKKWKLAATILNAHLRNPSVIERPDGGWMLMASRAARGGGSGGEDAILEVYLSKGSGTKGLTGTWRRHPASPAAVESATQAGRLLRVGGSLYRFGRSCVRGQCGPIKAFIVHLGPESYEQDEVELQLGRSFWRQLSAWNGAGHTHVDILPQAHGNWIAGEGSLGCGQMWGLLACEWLGVGYWGAPAAAADWSPAQLLPPPLRSGERQEPPHAAAAPGRPAGDAAAPAARGGGGGRTGRRVGHAQRHEGGAPPPPAAPLGAAHGPAVQPGRRLPQGPALQHAAQPGQHQGLPRRHPRERGLPGP